MKFVKTRKVAATTCAAALAVAMCLGGTACGGGSSDSGASSAADANASAASSTATSENGVQQVQVTLSNNQVQLSTNSVEAGPVTFTVTNESSPAIIECELLYNQKIINEKENLAPGLDPVSFTSTLDGGDYQIYCPGAEEEYTDFTVTGEAAEAPSGSTQDILKDGVEQYREYVANQTQYLQDTTKELQQAVNSGNVQSAKEAYAKARPYYERAESAVDGFMMPGATNVEDNTQNLDYMIDMRASNLDKKAGWHGFHAIERDLWQKGKITKNTKKLAKELAKNCKILNEQVIPDFTKDLKPEDLANGAADLLEEVSTTKITGEEEAYSHLDLLDFRANVEGADQAYACMRDGLIKIDEDLVKKIDKEFKAASDLLDGYRDSNELGGYKPYTAKLKKSDSKKMSKVILPLHDDVAKLAEKVATA